jgi:Helix-turn-helix domain
MTTNQPTAQKPASSPKPLRQRRRTRRIGVMKDAQWGADYAGVSVRKVLKWIAEGKFAAANVSDGGKKFIPRFREEDFLAFLEGRKVNPEDGEKPGRQVGYSGRYVKPASASKKGRADQPAAPASAADSKG